MRNIYDMEKTVFRFLTLYIVTMAVLVGTICYAKITAPSGINAGELAVAKSDESATWTVFPAEYKTAIYVADEGKTCIFASPIEGEVTLLAASISEGKIILSEHKIYNGVPIPDKQDSDEEETPQPKQETLTSIIEDFKAEVTADDYTPMLTAFESTVSGIERGTITTPAGARETFRAIYIQEAGKEKPEILKTFTPLLNDLSPKIDNTSLESIKTDYQKIIEAIKKKQSSLAKTSTKNASKNNNSPNGNCPTGNCPNGVCPVNTPWRYR